MALRATLPYPPSANRYWRNWRGRMVVSDEARRYKSDVGKLVQKNRLVGPVAVTLDLFRPLRRGDLDNRVKVLLDALRGLAFDDDDQVVHLVARRFDDKANPRVEVIVEPADIFTPRSA